jgi:hypothetical protein
MSSFWNCSRSSGNQSPFLVGSGHLKQWFANHLPSNEKLQERLLRREPTGRDQNCRSRSDFSLSRVIFPARIMQWRIPSDLCRSVFSLSISHDINMVEIRSCEECYFAPCRSMSSFDRQEPKPELVDCLQRLIERTYSFDWDHWPVGQRYCQNIVSSYLTSELNLKDTV